MLVDVQGTAEELRQTELHRQRQLLQSLTPEQQAAIVRMRALRAEGASLQKIAAVLTVDGTPISHVGVKKALAANAVPARA